MTLSFPSYWQSLFIELSLKTPLPCDTTTATALAAVEASLKSRAAAIIVLTSTGRSAYLLSKYKPRCPILTLTPNPKVARQAHLYSGILPHVVEKAKGDGNWAHDIEQRVNQGISLGKQLGIIAKGDTIILVTGSKAGPGFTDCVRIVHAQ